MGRDVELLPPAWFEDVKKSFEDYWEATPWQAGGDFAVKRLEKGLSSYARLFRELPGNLIPMAMDQYLAALWHARSARSGDDELYERFGARPWPYRAFLVADDLGDHRYRCVAEEGEVFHLWSHGLGQNLREGSRLFLALLIDVGEGWWMTYGPLFGWKGLLPGDLAHLASRAARQRFVAEGFDSVVRADPLPFWAAWHYGTKPVIVHGPGAVMSAWLEGRLDPGFGEDLPRTWRREDAGKKSRWLHGEDFFKRKEIYLNRATGEAFLYARTKDDLEKTRKVAGASFVPRGGKESCGILMEIIVKDVLGQELAVSKWERPFAGKP